MRRLERLCFRPLAGLSCINHTRDPIIQDAFLLSFRPLAGLSCINHALDRSEVAVVIATSFRPLAGLSCINLDESSLAVVLEVRVSVPSRG